MAQQQVLDQQPVLLMVICAHCPFVKHVEPELTRLDNDFGDRVQLIGVSSNSLITHPQDGPSSWRTRPDATAGVSPTCWMSSKPWPELSGPPARRSSTCSLHRPTASRPCATAASWMAVAPAMISPSTALTCGPPWMRC